MTDRIESEELKAALAEIARLRAENEKVVETLYAMSKQEEKYRLLSDAPRAERYGLRELVRGLPCYCDLSVNWVCERCDALVKAGGGEGLARAEGKEER
jgi:hypothetical protein